MIQIGMNVSTEYNLKIDYEKHRCTMNSFPWDHSYTRVVVDMPVMVSNRETVCDFRIGNFPFWVDTSGWSNGALVTISGSTYTISSEGVCWKAYREIDDSFYDTVYYHKDTGIFYESYTNRAYMDTFSFKGYTEDTKILSSNIDGFAARVTGSNVVANIVLLSAIFTEVLIVQRLYSRKKKAKTSMS